MSFISLNNLEYFWNKAKEYINNILSTKQDTLNNGVNIKTINGESILGSGNINLGSKPLYETTSTNLTLVPNVYYRQTSSNLYSLTFTLGTITDNTIMNEYFIEFSTPSSNTSVTMPSNIAWVNGEIPSFEPNSKYQISIVNNLGVVQKFS